MATITPPPGSTPTSFAAEGHSGWSYEGNSGPDHWADLDKKNAVCGHGAEQSPVDLVGAVGAELEGPSLHWDKIALKSVVNNGHTIQVNTPDAGYIELDGTRYDLLQFHFHHMSEHAVDGKRFPLEVHFVHKSKEGGLAVVGIFLEEGDENPALAKIWRAMPGEEGEVEGEGSIEPVDFLPDERSFFRYAGSLTTPPCSEVVAWTVYKEPVSASASQIEAFAKLFEDNARPLQAVNRRFLLVSE